MLTASTSIQSETNPRQRKATVGTLNYKVWYKMIECELGGLKLLPFIKAAPSVEGLVKLLPEERNMLSFNAILYLKGSISTNVRSVIRQQKTAYDIFKILKELYKHDSFQDLVSLERNFENLRFMLPCHAWPLQESFY